VPGKTWLNPFERGLAERALGRAAIGLPDAPPDVNELGQTWKEFTRKVRNVFAHASRRLGGSLSTEELASLLADAWRKLGPEGAAGYTELVRTLEPHDGAVFCVVTGDGETSADVLARDPNRQYGSGVIPLDLRRAQPGDADVVSLAASMDPDRAPEERLPASRGLIGTPSTLEVVVSHRAPAIWAHAMTLLTASARDGGARKATLRIV
jgi:hypothetical protein